MTKVPSELSKRLLQAQSAWDAELQTLKARVHQFEAELHREAQRGSKCLDGNENSASCQRNAPVDLERISQVQSSLDDLRSDLLAAESAQEAAVRCLTQPSDSICWGPFMANSFGRSGPRVWLASRRWRPTCWVCTTGRAPRCRPWSRSSPTRASSSASSRGTPTSSPSESRRRRSLQLGTPKARGRAFRTSNSWAC